MRRGQPDRRTFRPTSGFLGGPAPGSRAFIESRRLLQERRKPSQAETPAEPTTEAEPEKEAA